LDISEVRTRQGMTGRIDGREVAVSILDGDIRVMENICTHRACPLIWNGDERFWDCQCHGSRFSADGRVLRGPASEPLRALRHVVTDGRIELARE